VVSALVARFREAMTANAARVHGPFPAGDAGPAAARLAVERAGERPVAVSTGDPLVARLELPAHLAGAGAAVLTPDDPAWRQALATAGAGVTGAAWGLAATGTVGLCCGPGSPRATSLVPPAHVCVVEVGDLVEDLAEALRRLAAEPSGLASGLVWVSGPSRSADIELTLTLGVHGPASVDVVLVDGPG
jgi:L-lactate dehydrogenase complex protein LldG